MASIDPSMSCSFCDGVEMRWKYVKTRRMYFSFFEKHSNTSVALQSELIIFKCDYTLQSACSDVMRLISIPRLMYYNICTGLLEMDVTEVTERKVRPCCLAKHHTMKQRRGQDVNTPASYPEGTGFNIGPATGYPD
jgi:hypothetical protein